MFAALYLEYERPEQLRNVNAEIALCKVIAWRKDLVRLGRKKKIGFNIVDQYWLQPVG